MPWDVELTKYILQINFMEQMIDKNEHILWFFLNLQKKFDCNSEKIILLDKM